MKWTAERDEVLLRELAAGRSASQIANVLGTTRNAIIGRAHRLKGTIFPHITQRQQERAERAAATSEAREGKEATCLSELLINLSAGMPRKRAVAIAARTGVSYRVIASQLGVTRQRAHQLAQLGNLTKSRITV